MGSSMALSALRVPSEMVNRRSLVRSKRASRIAFDAMRLTDSSVTAASTTPPTASVRRLNRLAVATAWSTAPVAFFLASAIGNTSSRLALVDDDLVHEQCEGDQGQVEHDGGQIEDALGDALEVREEAERRDGRHQPLRRPGAEELLHRLMPAHDQQEAQRRRHDEGDHLV